ncbi:MAG: sulfotransferase domain-containing protein [Actinomycetota bacterium]
MGADYGTGDRLKLVPARARAACYLDLGHHLRDTTLVVSTGRSGSTWVAEVLNHANEYRLVFEPFRSDRVRKARAFRLGQYIDPEDQEHPLAQTIDGLLAGRVRGWWTDRQNRRRIASRRIVKEIRITNLVPWIRTRHPALRIVYAVRDPVAVARSWLELGWGDGLEEFLDQEPLLARFREEDGAIREIAGHGDQFERHILRWCLENAIPLKREPAPDVHHVVYERLRTEPQQELERLFGYLGKPVDGAYEAVRKPSATAGFPRTRSVTITEGQRRRAHEIIELFDLADVAPGGDASGS